MIVPRLGAEHFKTYEILAPLSTHFRKATCREVECRGYSNGWITTVLPDSPQANYIRRSSGRSFTEERNADGTVSFRFPAGQMCFRAAEHHASLEREPLYRVRGGDARGNPMGGPAQNYRAEDWVDDFAEHQQGIADRVNRG